MPKTDTTKPAADAAANADERDETIRELEESNASLAQRVGELQSDIEARDADLAQATARAEQLARDLETTRSNLITSEAERASAAARTAAVEAKHDEALRERDGYRESWVRDANDLRRETETLQREVEGLHDEIRRRSSGAPLALDITALLDLHRILGGDSYLTAARRLGDRLALQHADADG